MTTTRIAVAAVLACGLLGWTAEVARAGGPPEWKCSGTKRLAAAKKEKAKLICYSKAAAKNLAVDPACLTKAELGFDALTTKAGGGCADPGDGLSNPTAPIEGDVDQCVNQVLVVIPGNMNTEKCTASKQKAAGVAAGAELTCYAKSASSSGGATDPAPCVAAAQTKLEAAITKADGSAPCPGNAGQIEGALAANCITTIANQLPPKLPGCGDGVVEPGLGGENCDSGATNGNVGDPCPGNCVIQPCTPVSGSSRPFDVFFTPPAGKNVTGITVNLDYPEGRVSIPGHGGDSSVTGSISHVPFGAFSQPNDVDWALVETIGKATPLNPASRLFTVTFNDCNGATPPVAADFTCTVADASDDSNPPQKITGVTCSVQ